MNQSQTMTQAIYPLLIHDLKAQVGNLQGLWGLMQSEAQQVQDSATMQWLLTHLFELIEILEDFLNLEKKALSFNKEKISLKQLTKDFCQQMAQHPDWQDLAITGFKEKDYCFNSDFKRLLRSLKHLSQAFKKHLPSSKQLKLSLSQDTLIFSFEKKINSQSSFSLKASKPESWSLKDAKQWTEVLHPSLVLEKLGHPIHWQEDNKHFYFKFSLGAQS